MSVAGPVKVGLDEALAGIHEAIVSMLESERENPSGLLDDVVTIVHARRARPAPRPPSLWVFFREARNDQPTAIHETWDGAYSLVSVVLSEDPEEGQAQAESIASRGRSAVIQNWRQAARSLGYVRSVRSVSFDPYAAEAEDNRNLYSASATISVRFNVREEA